MATIKKTVFEPVEAGVYPAQVVDIVEEDGAFGRQLKWHFALEEPGLEDKQLIGWCSLAFSPKSKLWGWTKSLLFGGRDIPDYFDTLDTDKLLGQRAQVVVSMERGNDGTAYNKIKDVLPLRSARTGAATPAAPAPQPAANGGNGGAVVTRTAPRQPVTAASAAGVAPQRAPVSTAEPPAWPVWDAEPEPPGAGPYDAEMAF